MLGFGDQVSESITHFIGYFSTSIEAIKLRLDYREFKVAPDILPTHSEILLVGTDPHMQLASAEFNPDLNYLPIPWAPAGIAALPQISFAPIDIPVHDHGFHQPFRHQQSSGHSAAGQSAELGAPIGPQAPETSLVLQQTGHMQDNDVVVMGGPSIADLHWSNNSGLAGLSIDALLVSEPFLHELPGTAEEMPQFYDAQLENIVVSEQTLAGLTGITVISSPIEGVYLNGSKAQTAPTLDDYRPVQSDATNSRSAAASNETMTIDGTELSDSISVVAGSNILANEVVLNNTGTPGTHFAVAGDYYNINAIVQTNAYSDTDSFSSGFTGQQQLCPPSTNAVNTASFASHTGQMQAPATSGGAPVFPQNWQVTVMNGDLMQMNWVSQYNFLSDNDAHILSSGGSHTTITTGGNGMLNTASFDNLCSSYDLVVIGGNLYSGNLIFQTNVLLDDDTITTSAVGPYGGKLSTGDNLLWNSAGIKTAGTTNWVAALPDHYKTAINGLANGDHKMPDGFHSDQALQGLAGLKMLYISGNVYDLNYISQTNILGDSDYVAQFEDALRTASHDTVWDISTGSNALINSATIVDSGHGNGMSYAGGGIYSDSILIQAGIIDSASGYMPGQSQPLANEVIAFLEDDALQSQAADHAPVHLSDTTHSVDVMQTALA